MKKLQSLIKLREVFAKQEQVAVGYYFSPDENSCCAIGHLLKLGDVTNEQLIEIDKGKYGEHAYSIRSILRTIQNEKFENDFVKDALEKLGFNIYEDTPLLILLQAANDEKGKMKVIDELDDIILGYYGFQPRKKFKILQ